MTTFVFIVILAFFTWRGYQKGFVGAISRVLSFIVAYPAAIFLTKPFANILRVYTGLDGLILFLVAGCTIFFVTSLLVTLLLSSLARLAPTNSITETGSKIGGVVFGAIIGGVFGFIAVYLINLTVKTTTPAIADQHEQNTTSTNTATTTTNAEEAESIKTSPQASAATTSWPGRSFPTDPAQRSISTAISLRARRLRHEVARR